MATLKQRKNGTIDFSVAITIFTTVQTIPRRVKSDLNDLRDYRNGVVHYEGETKSTFEISKQCLRLLEWLCQFIERKLKWWLDGDLSTIDPMGKKRDQLKHLKKFIRSEQQFNVERRILKHENDFQNYYNIYSKAQGRTYIPTAKILNNAACPACSHLSVEINATLLHLS